MAIKIIDKTQLNPGSLQKVRILLETLVYVGCCLVTPKLFVYVHMCMYVHVCMCMCVCACVWHHVVWACVKTCM